MNYGKQLKGKKLRNFKKKMIETLIYNVFKGFNLILEIKFILFDKYCHSSK